jgi:hypothetical protein
MWLYIFAFVAFGVAGVLTLYVTNKFEEKSTEKQVETFKELTDSQTRELVESMQRVSGISNRIDSLTKAIQGGDTSQETINRLNQEVQSLSQTAGRWAQEANRRRSVAREEVRIGELSAEARAKKCNEIVRPHYAYFLESLEAHINAMRRVGHSVTVRKHAELPTQIIEAREPVIKGDSLILMEVEFTNKRRWTVIYTSGGASESALFLPYFHVALAGSGDQGHGPNYLELHMQDTPDRGIVFSIRSNFDSVKRLVAKENGSLAEFREHVDQTFRVLLEREQARQ